jgi:AAA family ATP:ADP antiporter
MFACAQLGLIVGTAFVAYSVNALGFGILFAISGTIVACIMPFLMRSYIASTPIQMPIQGKTVEQKTGMFEGLKLLITHPYVAGLLVVTTAYEVIGTIVEFQMGMCATQIYSPTDFAWFKAMNGLALGILALTFALLGTSFLMRRFGLKFCIMSFPIMIGIAVISIFAFYMAGVSNYFLMWACFIAVVLFKGLSYTLNNPAKEVLYIPTSKDVKFKSKSWIDGFGGRTSKGAGAVVTGSLGGNLPLLIMLGSVISLGIVAFWIFVAAFVVNKFNELQRENKIIE